MDIGNVGDIKVIGVIRDIGVVILVLGDTWCIVVIGHIQGYMGHTRACVGIMGNKNGGSHGNPAELEMRTRIM